MTELLRRAWRTLRELSGDDAYERYLAHRRTRHPSDAPAPSRAEFFRADQERRWDGVKRCC